MREHAVRMVWIDTGQRGGTTTEQAEKVKAIGIESVVRGKKPKATLPDKALACLLDKVNRQFHALAPNVL